MIAASFGHLPLEFGKVNLVDALGFVIIPGAGVPGEGLLAEKGGFFRRQDPARAVLAIFCKPPRSLTTTLTNLILGRRLDSNVDLTGVTQAAETLKS